MLFGISEYLRLFAFYSLIVIGANTVYKNGVYYVKQKSSDLLEWIHHHYPGIFVWITLKFGWQLENKWKSELEKLLPFTDTLQKEIDQITDEHLKEEVTKTFHHLQNLIYLGQNILESPRDFINISNFKIKYTQLSNELFELFEKNYYR